MRRGLIVLSAFLGLGCGSNGVLGVDGGGPSSPGVAGAGAAGSGGAAGATGSSAPNGGLPGNVPPPLTSGAGSSGRPNCVPQPRTDPCQVAGAWTVSYSAPSVACNYGGQTQSFTIIVENGLLCVLGDDDLLSLSSDGCSVRLAGARSSGAGANKFDETWEQVLSIAGDAAVGTLSYKLRGGTTCDVTYEAAGMRRDVDGGSR